MQPVFIFFVVALLGQVTTKLHQPHETFVKDCCAKCSVRYEDLSSSVEVCTGAWSNASVSHAKSFSISRGLH